jgi:hypothetical protein
MLQPSITRCEYGTLTEWHECLEIAGTMVHGTLKPEQYAWLEAYGTVPPHIADIEMNVRDALREMQEYDEASHGESDNGLPFDITEQGELAA